MKFCAWGNHALYEREVYTLKRFHQKSLGRAQDYLLGCTRCEIDIISTRTLSELIQTVPAYRKQVLTKSSNSVA